MYETENKTLLGWIFEPLFRINKFNIKELNSARIFTNLLNNPV